MPRLSRLALLLLPLALAACDSNDPDERADVAGVYVLNQGAFGNDASGSVTVYDPETMATSSLAAPGGLVQSGAIRDGKLYLLLNFSNSFSTGSGRLDVIDVETGATERQIDVGTPRGIAFSGGTAYVTNLYGASITPVDLASGTAGTPIPVGQNPEGLAVSGGELFVANSGFGAGSTLSVIDASTNAVVETLDLGCSGPNEVIADGDGDLWVVCTGSTDFSTGDVTGGQVIAIDAASRDVVARFEYDGETLGGAALGQDAAFDPAAEFLYVIQTIAGEDDYVIRFDTRSNDFEAESTVSGGDLSGIGFAGDRFYLARLDPDNPFSDNGTVSIQERSGAFAGSFDAGVIPAAFAVEID